MESHGALSGLAHGRVGGAHALELNPNIPAIATQILEEARIGTMEELEKAKAKRGGVVVGLDGKPARA